MPFEYQVGGSLRADSPSYVYRPADELFYEYLRAGQFCYVLNSRQMGKSSLRVQAIRRLQVDGFACIFVDLTGMGRQDLTPEKWYAGFVQALVVGSSLGRLPWRSWWREQRDLLSPCQCLSLFIEDVLCPAVGKPLIIFVDEVDRVLSQSFSLDDFFGLIRYFSEKKIENPQRYPLTFALLGVASPAELIQDRAKNPFNIGKAIALSGFQAQDAAPLLPGLQGVLRRPAQALQNILDWTGGQPFLTQKLCQLVAEVAQDNGDVSIESVVRSRIVDHWESQDEPEHLRTIRDRILRHPQTAVQCLGLYAELLNQGQILADASPAQHNLKLSGLVIEEAGVLRIHNRIYATLFNLEWVLQQLSELRPYAESLMAWCTAGQPSTQHLLTGESLDSALAWAANKQLSDLDYQYLVASQQQATRSAQTSLEINQQATTLLNQVRAEAAKRASRYRLPWLWKGLTALGIAFMLGGLKSLGVFQSLELSLYDFGIRWRPEESADQRIALITVDEQDIQTLRQWPLSDQALADVIQILQDQGVSSIGLDIYRDYPVEPGYSQLVTQLESSSNIFGIEKMLGQAIASPPALPSQQVGFADQVLDDDGVIRRALLSMNVAERLQFSLAVRLALHYLEQEGLVLQELEEGRFQLGQATYQRLDDGVGGYQRFDDGGYQILLNWRKAEFETIPLRQILDRQLAPNQLRDRIVLLGVTSEGTKDFFFTPHSYVGFKAPQPTAGVEVHAQIVSQLVSAALGERSQLRPSSKSLSWVWICGWASVGAIGIGQALRWRYQVGLLVGAIAAWFGGWLGLLMLGLWLPGVVGVLALISATAMMMLLTRWQRKQYQHQSVVSLLAVQSQTSPEAAQLALASFQNSEPLTSE